MKLIVVVALALVAAATAGPIEQRPIEQKNALANLLRSLFEPQPNGAYIFGFEVDNGITRDETGELKSVLDEDKKPHEVVVVRGQFATPGEDGKPVITSYYADETGFHAEGPAIPKGPAAIAARR